MNYQFKAFQISFLLHGVIIALVIIGSTFIGPYKKAVILNFDLRGPVSAVKKEEEPSPVPVIKTKSINPASHESLKEKEPSQLPEEGSKILAVPETPSAVKLPETTAVGKQPMEPGISDRTAAKETSFGIASGAKEKPGTTSGMDNADSAKETTRVKYLNDNFAYIRDKILRNVNYPDAARRMGWQGKVLLFFIITANGSVREFKVIKSSGFPVLDRNAIDTVKDTAPFPKPPVEAQLVIPIVYRLE